MPGLLENLGRSGALEGSSKQLIDLAGLLRKDKKQKELENVRVPLGKGSSSQAIPTPVEPTITQSEGVVTPAQFKGAEIPVPGEGRPERAIPIEDEQAKFEEVQAQVEEAELQKVQAVEDTVAFKQLAATPTAQNMLVDVAVANGWIEDVGGVQTISNKNLQIAQKVIASNLKIQKDLNVAALNDISGQVSTLEQSLLDPKLKPEEREQVQLQLEQARGKRTAQLNHVNDLDRGIQKELATRQPKAPAKRDTKITNIESGPEEGQWVVDLQTGEKIKRLGPATKKKGQTINIGGSKSQGAFFKKLGEDSAAATVQSQTDALDSASTINIIRDGRAQVDKGIFSGTGAKARLAFDKFLKVGGITLAGKKVENTETFAANAGSLVGKIIKQFGAGTGLSDADREYAQKIVGGDITIEEGSIRRLLDIAERIQIALINEHNKKAEKVMSHKNFDLPIDLRVEIPESTEQLPQGVTEDDIATTMERHKMTRQQVLERLQNG